eukprot:TRINITY_DN6918_c0_g1_i5.p2 TRINITY_DN6918_c0_g1~~TRINITY_DN6918_c0_g1_i5.p2  ORF type:complete len:104 (+),score=11.02 TRINITY_DN6918_c0_g1_i5:77-388(+)
MARKGDHEEARKLSREEMMGRLGNLGTSAEEPELSDAEAYDMWLEKQRSRGMTASGWPKGPQFQHVVVAILLLVVVTAVRLVTNESRVGEASQTRGPGHSTEL